MSPTTTQQVQEIIDRFVASERTALDLLVHAHDGNDGAFVVVNPDGSTAQHTYADLAERA